MERIILKIKKTSNPEFGYNNKSVLYIETEQHRTDVFHLMSLLALELINIGHVHDWSKIEYFDQFAKDTLERQNTPDFKQRPWYQVHTEKERHHINAKKPKNINLLDILEFICDCVVAGKARSGEVDKSFLEIPDEVLREAFWNTIDKIIEEVEVEE